ncbi:MAG TPA: hypothetical protein ENH59_10695 [Bacteroidetes bacterium]|nr:hypothetical protein [Bacteroidota bacterium]
MIRLYLGKIIIRLRMIFEKFTDALLHKLILAYLRNDAHMGRNVVTKSKETKVLSNKLKKSIKEYSKDRFGSKNYWHYLALYTEIRGEFLEGWLPYDYYRFVFLPRINPKPALYLNDLKTYDYRLFGDFALKPLFLFISGMFFNTDLETVGKDDVKSFMSEYNDNIVIKEESGWGGEQVRIINPASFSPYELPNDKNYVIQPFVEQYKVLNDLYPESVNTFRVNTFLKKDGSVIPKYVWLRFGKDGMRVDNGTMGGDFLFFDLAGNPEPYSYDHKTGMKIGDRHKNTGYLYSDVKIPMFGEIIEKCKVAHKKFPYSRLIAWDVCIDSSGKPVLLEWNANNPDFPTEEAKFGPFWPNDEEI